MTLKNSAQVGWRSSSIDSVKAEIKRELDALMKKDGEAAKLKYASRRIDELAQSSDQESQLRCFVYVMSVLVHQERYGGLSHAQIRKIVDISQSILMLQGIKAGTSKLSYLHGELHLVLSQIYRKSGEHWLALWEQQLSTYASARAKVGGKGFEMLSAANRNLRLGLAHIAIGQFAEAEKEKVEGSSFEKARLGRIKATRLAGELGEAQELCHATVTDHVKDFSEGGQLELAWEEHSLIAQRENNPSSLINASKRGKPHYQSVFLLETFLWLKAHRSTLWLKQVSSIKTLARNKDLKPQDLGFFFQACLELERATDEAISPMVRLESLGYLISNTKHLLTIDRELLLWVAVIRWLIQNNRMMLVESALGEYQSLSLKLTSGKSRDVMNTAEDLIEKFPL